MDHHQRTTTNSLRLVTPGSQSDGLRRVRSVPLIAAVGADSIVREELESGRLGLEALRTAWKYREATHDPRDLWRILADVQGTDASALFRAAAEREGFLNASISATQTKAFLMRGHRHFPMWRLMRMVETGAFAAVQVADLVRANLSCSLVSFEPQTANVQSLQVQFGGFVGPMRFTSPSDLADLIATCLGAELLQTLWWYQRYVAGRRPIRLYTSEEFVAWRQAA